MTTNKIQNKINKIQEKILALYEKLYKLETQLKNSKRICPICKTKFVAIQTDSIYCSRCRRKRYMKHYYETRIKTKRANIRASKKKPSTPLIKKTCLNCGKEFVDNTTSKSKKFCDKHCRDSYYTNTGKRKEYGKAWWQNIKKLREEYKMK